MSGQALTYAKNTPLKQPDRRGPQLLGHAVAQVGATALLSECTSLYGALDTQVSSNYYAVNGFGWIPDSLVTLDAAR